MKSISHFFEEVNQNKNLYSHFLESNCKESDLTSNSPVSIRLNPSKRMVHSHSEQVPWCENAFYLSERPSFTLDPLFHAGAYYVQEASSMFLDFLIKESVDVKKSLTVLDLCAAPGGKSTLLLSLLSKESILVANEMIPKRAAVLAENIQKWGMPNVLVTNNRPSDFSSLDGLFDVIVVDAPCSGEGLFRKDAGAINEWSLDNVAQCSVRQKEILNDIWPSLKKGGVLLYSTCTYNDFENEQNIDYILENFGAEPVVIKAPSFEGITETKTDKGGQCFRFIPNKTKGEGFFISAIRKTEDSSVVYIKKPSNKEAFPKDLEQEIRTFIHDEEMEIVKQNGFAFAFPTAQINLYYLLKKYLKPFYFGVEVAEIKGKDIIPSPHLALSQIYNKEKFPLLETDKENALKFLKRENFAGLNQTPKGWNLVTHQGLGLGWVKNLGNRFNNYYPTQRKIRMNLFNEL